MAFFSLVLIRSHNNRYSGGGGWPTFVGGDQPVHQLFSGALCVSAPLSQLTD